MQVIWAVGQEPGEPGVDPQWPASADEINRIQAFYKKGELKSHGHASQARGKRVINFFTGEMLTGQDPGLQRSDQSGSSHAPRMQLVVIIVNLAMFFTSFICIWLK